MNTVKIVKSDKIVGGLTTFNTPISQLDIELTSPLVIETEFETPIVTVVLEGVYIDAPLTITVGGLEFVINEQTPYATYTFPYGTDPSTITISSDEDATIGIFKAYPGKYEAEVIVAKPIHNEETKSINLAGWFLELEFDAEEHAQDIQQDFIILSQTKTKGEQPFRVHNIEKDADTIYVHANHVIFDAHTYVVTEADIQSSSAVVAIDVVNRNTDPISPFSLDGNVGGSLTANYSNMTLFEALDGIQKAWGGYWDIDGFSAYLRESMGSDTGLSLVYGKNIEGLRYIENWDGVVTKVFPSSSDGLEIDPIESEIQYTRKYNRAVEFTLEVPEDRENDEVYKQELLRGAATTYLATAQYPKIGISVQSNIPQNFGLMDTINIYHPAITKNIDLETGIGADQTAFPIRVLSYVYNVIAERVTRLEYGDYTQNSYTIFSDRIDTIEKEINKNIVNQDSKLREQTDLIRNLNKNGHVYIDDNTIYLLDRLPKEDAEVVWMIGNGGIGVSRTGIEGDFVAAWDLKLGFNADFITAGTLDANRIRTNSITSDHLSIDAIDLIVNLSKGGGKNRIKSSAFLGEAPNPWTFEGVTTNTVYTAEPTWTTVSTNNLVPTGPLYPDQSYPKYQTGINVGTITSNYDISNPYPYKTSENVRVSTSIIIHSTSPTLRFRSPARWEPVFWSILPTYYLNPQGVWVYVNRDSDPINQTIGDGILYPTRTLGDDNIYVVKTEGFWDYYQEEVGSLLSIVATPSNPVTITSLSRFLFKGSESESMSYLEGIVLDGKAEMWGVQFNREVERVIVNNITGSSNSQYVMTVTGRGGAGADVPAQRPKVVLIEEGSSVEGELTLDTLSSTRNSSLRNASSGNMGIVYRVPSQGQTGAVGFVTTLSNANIVETIGAETARSQVMGETSSWASQYPSAFAIAMYGVNTVLTQRMSVVNPTTYTFQFAINKTSTGGVTYVRLYGVTGVEQTLLVDYIAPSGATVDEVKIYTLDSLGSLYPEVVLEIEVVNTLVDNKTYLADLVLKEGIEGGWESAEGETITTNFIMNEDGFSVVRRDGISGTEVGRTVMSPFEFSGFYNNQRVFSLNGDITETEGLLVRSKGLFIPPVKFVQNPTTPSLDVVWTGLLED